MKDESNSQRVPLESKLRVLERSYFKVKIVGTVLIIVYFFTVLFGLRWFGAQARNPDSLAQTTLEMTTGDPEETRDFLLKNSGRIFKNSSRLIAKRVGYAPKTMFEEFGGEIRHRNKILTEEMDSVSLFQKVIDGRRAEIKSAAQIARNSGDSSGLEREIREGIRVELRDIRGENKRGAFDTFVAFGGLISALEDEGEPLPERRFEKLVITTAGILIDEN